ncbi:MAG: hypothetical protein EZS28_047872 [Streblomastix strix]|uniref:Uncharacterized protein n=1 Tax=Streblomastix strix TaxID=222440 RepID=A0A5J4TGA4_9EUKA|nr:MAG: hypothetical protein EZS28_047872 [Streblomastix strix]
MLPERVRRRYGPFRTIKQWRIEEVLHDWIPDLDVRECAERLAKIEQKALSDLILIVIQFMRKRRFHLFPNTDQTQYFQPLDSLSFSELKQSIQNGRCAKIKLTPAEGVLDAIDALQEATTIKTTQAAQRLVGIDYMLDIVPLPSEFQQKELFGLLNEEYINKK